MRGGWFGTPSAGHASASHVHQTVQEGARRDDHSPRPQFGAPHGGYALHLPIFCDDFGHLVLPDAQVFGVLHHVSPRLDEFGAVALSPWAPHGRTF